MKPKSIHLTLIILLAFSFLSLEMQGKEREIEILKSTDKILKLKVNFTTFDIYKQKLPDGKIYSKVLYPSAGNIEYIGKPDLPVIRKRIMIPNGTNPQITIKKSKPEIIEGILINPAQEPLLDCQNCNEKVSFVYDSLLYNTNANFPGKYALVKPTKDRRGFKTSIIELYPCQYNPVLKTLEVYHEMIVDINFIGDRKPVSQRLQSNNIERMLKSVSLNGEKIIQSEKMINSTEYYPDGRDEVNTLSSDESGSIMETTTYSTSGSSSGCELLIITYDDFKAAADTLSEWKNSIGINTIVTKTSAIDGSYNSLSDSAKRSVIENYIDNAYNNWNPAPEYLLLIGDAEHIPPFYDTNDYYCKDTLNNILDTGFWYAGDLNYAEVGNVDYAPELFYGRISVDYTAEAINVVQKIKKYEDGSLPASFYSNAAVLGDFQVGSANREPSDWMYGDDYVFGDCDTSVRRFIKTCEDVRNYLINEKNYNVKRLYNIWEWWPPDMIKPCRYNGTKSYLLFENDTPYQPIPNDLQNYGWDDNYQDVISAIDQGKHIMLYRDHGHPDKWHRILRSSQMSEMYNGDKTPVVFSICCYSGHFDNETDDDSLHACRKGYDEIRTDERECFAEEFLRHDDGCCGILASSRTSWSGTNDRLTWGIFDAIYPGFIEYHNGNYGNNDPFYRIGDIVDYGMQYTETKKGNIDITRHEFNYFGDPTMRIYPYQCDPGTIVLEDETQNTDEEINACRDVVIDGNYTVASGADLTIKAGNSISVYGPFEVENGGTISFEGVDIKTGFLE